jgi:YidC/Oxa1 family membrane protein insertase
MSTKSTLIGMAALFFICMGYLFVLNRFVYKAHPNWDYNGVLNHPSAPTDNASTAPSTQPSPALGGVASTQTFIGPATQASSLQVAATQPAQLLTLGHEAYKDPDYALALQVDPSAAGLQSVTINSYKNSDESSLYVYQQSDTDDPRYLSLATRGVTIDGQTVDLANANWYLEPGATPMTATLGVDVLSPDHSPLLHISKTYQLQPRGPKSNRDNTSAGYEISVVYHLRNLTTHALKDVSLDFDGPTMPPREMERSDDRQIVAGYDQGDSSVYVTRDYLASFKAGADNKDISAEKGYKFLWAGECSVYFAAIVRPENEGQISSVHATCLNPNDEADQRLVRIDFQTADQSIPAASSLDVPLKVFFGPKERDLFKGDYFGVFPYSYNQLLSTSASLCGFCAFAWLVDLLVNLLQAFHWVLHDWGLAVITLVIIVRAILHPISKSSQVSMLKMQKMGPEMERLKKKYGDDKEGLAKAQMEVTKEMGITPFLGCLPMFLQMPIWIALYSALQSDIVLRQAPFLWGFTWIHDLSRPDRLISWDQHPFTVPVLGMKLTSLNILPLMVAVVMFIQQKMQPQPPTLTAEQAQQQKMMRYMSLLFSLFFYWMPSGLNLYILTSSTIAIFESKIIRDHIKQREERDKGNRVIVDAKPTRQGKQKNKLEQPRESNSGCLGQFWSNLQEKAEEVRREAQKKSKRD